jgi:hypothetical protein
LTIPNDYCKIKRPASLRSEGCSDLSRKAVRLASGTAFAFVGIPNNEKTCFFFFTLADTEIDAEATFQKDALVDVTGAFSQANFNSSA